MVWSAELDDFVQKDQFPGWRFCKMEDMGCFGQVLQDLKGDGLSIKDAFDGPAARASR